MDRLEAMTTMEHITTITKYLSDKPHIRRPLSKLGALNISRQEAKVIANSSIAPASYCILVVDVEDKGIRKAGYILEQDLGNNAYSTWLDQSKALSEC
eukprot:7572031-Heterocapsa_arctica.AAC.1